MKLLILTQAVDTTDTTLGFFHRWIEEFSKRVQSVEVICLRKGEYSLPKNVHIHSLEKESGSSRLKRIFLFYYFSISHSSDYDIVFVHMNQEYVLLGGLLWKLLGKKVFLWRNHPHGDVFTDIAVSLSDHVFCTSSHSYTARFKDTTLMPAGIDIDFLMKSEKEGIKHERKKNSLLMFGRVAPVKNIDVAIDAVATLKTKGIEVTLSIVGDALPKDVGYLQTLKDRVDVLGISHLVYFEKGVTFKDAPSVYERHEVFLNFTPSGSFDKTVVEALACGSKVLVSNISMKDILQNDSVINGDSDNVAHKIEKLLFLDEKSLAEYNEKSREIVKSQSLDNLMDKLLTYFS